MDRPTRRRVLSALSTAVTACLAGCGSDSFATASPTAETETTEEGIPLTPSATVEPPTDSTPTPEVTARVNAHEKLDLTWREAHETNYAKAERPDDYPIRWYVVHVGQGSYEDIVNWFENLEADVSTHYTVANDEAGTAAQQVDESDIAWHAGNGPYNDLSLGIEHGGYIGETEYVDGCYRMSARIAAWAAQRYDFPLRVRRYDIAPCNAYDGEGGIIGHSQIPDPDNCEKGGGANRHTDPGSTWNWGRYEGFLRQFHLAPDDHALTQRATPIRAEPAPDAEKRARADAEAVGTVREIAADGDRPGWYRIEFDVDRPTGWVDAEYVLHSRFAPGSTVTTRRETPLKADPSNDAAEAGTLAPETAGTVRDGPVDGGTRWLDVEFEGERGWVADYDLLLA